MRKEYFISKYQVAPLELPGKVKFYSKQKKHAFNQDMHLQLLKRIHLSEIKLFSVSNDVQTLKQ